MPEEEIGTLIVVVLKAQNLHDKHFFKQDVYAQITFNGETKKTKIDVKGGQHPMWDEELRFPVYKIPSNGDIKKYRELTAGCWAKEHKDDTFLGEGKVDMTPTVKSGEFDEWIPLKTPEDQRGDIYLEITYYSNAPAPVRQASIPPTQQPPQKAQTQTQPYPPSQQPHSQSLLAVPSSAAYPGLGRRPSKLSPKERLSRGPLPGSLTPGPGRAAGSVGAAPSTLMPGPGLRVSPKQQVQGLPAVSNPSQSGLGARSSTPAAVPAAAPAVPSILRPGNPHADPHASVRAHPPRSGSGSRSPPRQQPQSPAASHYPNPYEAAPTYTHTHTPNPYEASPTHRHTPTPNPYEVASTPNPYVSSAQAGSIPFASASSVPTPAPGSTPGPRQSNGTVTLPYPGTTYTRQPSNPPVGGPGVLDWNSATQGGQISFPVPNFPVPGGVGGVSSVADNNGYGGVGGGGYRPENSSYHENHQRTTSYTHPPPNPNSPPYSHQPSFLPSQGPPYSPHPHSHPNHTASSSSDRETLPDPYLIARYQTPLPLPPSSKPSSSHSNHRRTVSAELSSRPVPPVPGISSSLSSSPTLPTVPPKSPSLSPKHSPSLSPSPPFTASADPLPRTRTPIDSSRLEALRQAEAEAARRKAQEEKDLELARLLDLEESKREERELREKVERLEREKKERLEREKQKKEEHTDKEDKRSQDIERVTAERRRAREDKIAREEERNKPTPKREPSPPVYVKAEALRKTQEERDMELAMQLDRELNL